MRIEEHALTAATRKGFSLIELLLVIFIVSLVYFLGFSTVQKAKKQTVAISVENLKSTLLQDAQITAGGTFICTEHCSQCYFRHDIASPFEPYKGKTALKDITVYTLDANDMLVREEPGRYQDEKVCLRIRFYSNGGSTPLVIKDSTGIYFLPSYFGKTQKTASLEKAHTLWLKQQNELKQSGAFY